MAQLKSITTPYDVSSGDDVLVATVPEGKFWYIQNATLDGVGVIDPIDNGLFGIILDGSTTTIPFFRTSVSGRPLVSVATGNLYCPPNSQIFLTDSPGVRTGTLFLTYFEFDNN